MDKIKINGSTSYEFIIDQGLLSTSGNILRKTLGGCNALIVCDNNTANLFLNKILASLEKAGYKTFTFIAKQQAFQTTANSVDRNNSIHSPAHNNYFSESIKNLDNYTAILNTLSDNNFIKTDLIIAVGGGVIGDLAGFAAATYKRGINFAICPTTLLSAVDSSIGGKNGINLPNAKNSVGTIYNPSIVLCDPSALFHLPNEVLHDAYAEIVKYGILEGTEIIDALNTAISNDDYFDIIRKSVNIKKKYVEEDEGDLNLRQFLNLGHLFGHAIEAYSNYTISHGNAVAKGLALETKCCVCNNLCELSVYEKVVETLKSLDFDLSCNYKTSELLSFISHDKRIKNDIINVIVPTAFGKCKMKPLSIDELSSFISIPSI